MKNTTTIEPTENALFSKTIAIFIKILMGVGIPANLFLLIVTVHVCFCHHDSNSVNYRQCQNVERTIFNDRHQFYSQY